ncbi:MAG TPA: alpha/beta hydrolase [Gemmatimonadales bacterium]
MSSKASSTVAVLTFCVCLATGAPALGQGAGVSDGFATTGSGVRIHYLQAGSKTDPPALILIPGWRMPAWLWREQLQRFSSVTRVLAIDPRSQGESSNTADDNTPETRASDLHDALQTLGVTRYVLVGWSQGAQDVAGYVKQFGTDAIAGIVFVDSPVSAGAAEVVIRPQFAQAILSNISLYAAHPKEFTEGMVRSLFLKPHPELDLQGVVTSALRTPTNTGIAMLVTDIFGVDRRPVLTTIDKPTLVIASAASPLLAAQREMASAVPGAKLIVVEDAGHAVFIDQPQQFDAALDGFLRTAATRQ